MAKAKQGSSASWHPRPHLDLGHIGRQDQVVGGPHVGERHNQLRPLRQQEERGEGGKQCRLAALERRPPCLHDKQQG